MSERHKVPQIEVLLADVWQRARSAAPRHGVRPNLDSYHTAEPHELTVIVEVPGIDPAALTVAVSERMLVVAGERRRAHVEGRVYQQMEIEYGPFERHVELPEDVDPERARARYEHGMLTISLPVAERPAAPERRTITVERR